MNEKEAQSRVTELITLAVDQRASDLHLESTAQGGRVRLRVDGALREVVALDTDAYAAVVQCVKKMACMDTENRSQPQNGRILVNTRDQELDLRVASLPCHHGEDLTLRLLTRGALLPSFERTGFTEAQQAALNGWVAQPNGVVLVTGPTGSGKTTVLYILLQQLVREPLKVCSVEDPVEYLIAGVSQVAVRTREGLTFAAALRQILRMDPDVVMCGEIREEAVANMLFQIALTGHLALSTLHTNSATEGLVRLRDIGVPPFVITSALRGIAAQRLVRVLCPQCRKETTPDRALLHSLGAPVQPYFAPVGCAACNQTGYQGRRAVVELLSPTDAIREALLRGDDEATIRRLAIEGGHKTLWDDGLAKACAGLTGLDELLRVLGGPQ